MEVKIKYKLNYAEQRFNSCIKSLIGLPSTLDKVMLEPETWLLLNQLAAMFSLSLLLTIIIGFVNVALNIKKSKDLLDDFFLGFVIGWIMLFLSSLFIGIYNLVDHCIKVLS